MRDKTNVLTQLTFEFLSCEISTFAGSRQHFHSSIHNKSGCRTQNRWHRIRIESHCAPAWYAWESREARLSEFVRFGANMHRVVHIPSAAWSLAPILPCYGRTQISVDLHGVYTRNTGVNLMNTRHEIPISVEFAQYRRHGSCGQLNNEQYRKTNKC